MDLTEIFQSSTFTISHDSYSIIQATVMYHDAFANVKVANDDITIVAKEKDATYHIPSKEIMNIDNGWRIITINAKLPMDLVGFLASISQAFAESEIAIFVISSFDTDHILVKNDVIKEASKILLELGFTEDSE